MWLKKMRHKRLQLFLIGLVLCVSAGIFNLCFSFTMEFLSFSKDAINEQNCPDSYLLTIGTQKFEDHFTHEDYLDEIESVKALTGRAVTVPIKYKGNDISMYYDMLLVADTYEDWGYLELVDGLNGTQPPQEGEIWISETIAVPNGLVLGDEITLLYDTPLALRVTGFYRSTCFPKSLGYAPMLVSKNQLDHITTGEDAAFFAVDIKDYSNDKMKSLLSDTPHFVLNRTRDDVQLSLIEFSGILGGIGIMATFIVFIVTMIIVGYIIKSSLVKEFKNIGVYKSLGYNSKQIVRIYMNGYLLVGFVAITIGVFIALPAVTLMGKVSTEFIDGFTLSSTSLKISILSIVFLLTVLWINLKKSFKRVKTISPVEAITVGLTSSQKKLSPSVIKNAKSPMAMAINEMFKYKKSTGLMILSITACMYLSMLFGMIWYSSFSMIDNSNLWFCLPENDVYIAGTISEELITYLDENQYVENMVYGDFSYKQEIKVEGYEDLVNYIRFDTYSDFSNDSTGIKLLEGDIPSKADEVLVGDTLLNTINLKKGDSLKLTLNNITKDFVIIGSYQTVADNGMKIMLPTIAVKSIISDYASSRAYIKLYDMDQYQEFKNEVEDIFPEVVVDEKWLAMENSVETTRAMLESISIVLISAFIIFSVLNIIIVILMDSKQSRRKLGILKSLGFTTEYIVKQNISKYFIVSILSSALALVLHLATSRKLTASILIDAFVNSPLVLTSLIAGFTVLILLATFLCGLTIKNISTVELMEE